MNTLNNTFIEYFSPFYYYDNSGRAYLEYSCSSVFWYTWKVGFFHFSLEDKKKNIFFNYKIYQFIQEHYSEAFQEISKLCEYCIKSDILLSIISVSDTRFLLRVSGGDKYARDIISQIYKNNIWDEFSFPHESYTCPIELDISTHREFTITSLRVFQKRPLPDLVEYQKGYIEEDNIFLTIWSWEYSIQEDNSKESYAVKLHEPIDIEKSWYLTQHYYLAFLENTFKEDELYVNCIEKKKWEDVIYFTKDYMIEA